MKLELPRKIHFVGIGGIGMSAIAEFLYKEGYKITGSDLTKSKNTKKLEKLGIKIFYNHNKDNITDSQMIVYSSAISESNPEINISHISLVRRAEMLNKIAKTRKYQIAIAGTHGKTITSALLTHIFTEAGFDPLAIVGGYMQNNNSNLRYGKGKYCILEADEFDHSLLRIFPTHTIITNIEAEHLDCYASLDSIKQVFKKFSKRISSKNYLVACFDDKNIKEILPKFNSKIKSYGIRENAKYGAINIKINSGGIDFILNINGKNYGNFKTSLYGVHNVLNSLACIAMAYECGISLKSIKKALKSFQGVKRRFEIIYKDENYILIDDYAHHPTQIIASLKTIREIWNRRIIAIFQPHLYSRTKFFYKDFADSLNNADIRIVTNIYPAREKPLKKVNAKMITNSKNNHFFLKYLNKKDLIKHIAKIAKSGDIIITLGAGDINKIHNKLLSHLIPN